MANSVKMVSDCARHQPIYDYSECDECGTEKAAAQTRCALCQIKLEEGLGGTTSER